MTKKVAIGALAAVVLATGGLLGGVLRDGGPAPRPAIAAAPDIVLDTTLSGFSPGDTESVVARLQESVRERPGDVESLGLLGLAYQQRARETGDPSYLTKAEGVLEQALALEPNDVVATTGLGALALARHEFEDALVLGRKAAELTPSSARPYGIIGDSLAELGRYRAAFEAFDTMVSLKPGIASYARVSYGRELTGDTAGAIEAMALAVDAARGTREPAAWAMTQLGKIHFSRGRFEAAARWYERALAALPGYVFATDALAHVEAARGNLARAVELEREAVTANPLPQFVAALGDFYAAAGRDADAAEQYALMDAIHALLTENGVRTDLETAVYLADHDLRSDEALRLARAAHAERPSIQADDALAWALYRNDRCEEARSYSERAFRLGTRDAAMFFHRGMIERCLGNTAAMRRWLERALELNPGFSVRQAPVARAALEELEA